MQEQNQNQQNNFHPLDEKLSTQQIPLIQCQWKNKADLICSSSTCLNPAFMCSVHECKCRRQLHISCCYFQSEPLLKKIYQPNISEPKAQNNEKNLQKIKQQSLLERQQIFKTKLKKVYNKIAEIYDGAIQFLSQAKQINLQKIKYHYLGSNQLKLKKLIDYHQFAEIDGNIIKNAMKQNCFYVYKQPNDIQKLQQYQVTSICSNLKKIKQDLSWLSFKFQSTIISKQGQYQILQGFFGKQFQKTKLAYRASSQNFDIKTFHEKCDELQNSLVLIKTQHKKIIGGYTDLNWVGEGYISGSADNTFVFSVSENRRFQKLNYDKSIYVSKNYGPCFGRDINVSTQMRQSKFDFPTYYNNPKDLLKDCTQTTKMFIGCEQKFCRIIEWEVHTILERDDIKDYLKCFKIKRKIFVDEKNQSKKKTRKRAQQIKNFKKRKYSYSSSDGSNYSSDKERNDRRNGYSPPYQSHYYN